MGPTDGKHKKGTRVMLQILIGGLVGAVAGYGYYRLVGCSTGACPLTSNPWVSTLYGLLMGILVAANLR